MSLIKDTVAIISILLGLVPQITELAKLFEKPADGVDTTGLGVDKAAGVTSIVVAGFEALPDDIKTKVGGAKIEEFTKKVLTAVVSFLNKIGVFKKSSV